MSEPNNDSFTEAHELYLSKLDESYAELRFFIADPDMLNTDYPKYKKAREIFEALLGDIQLFKSVWYEVRELKSG